MAILSTLALVIIVVIFIIIFIILIALSLWRERSFHRTYNANNNSRKRNKSRWRPNQKLNRKHRKHNNRNCNKSCGCKCSKSCEHDHPHRHPRPCDIPCPPVWNCELWLQGEPIETCGYIPQIQGTHLSWHPQCNKLNPITMWKIYASQYPNNPTPENYDEVFMVPGEQTSFDVPAVSFCWNFIITAVNECGESEPSRVFSMPCA